ncbi:hypothetical protein GPECTOR_56g404 [Gonium pectorale]|uniref:Ankyrin repeat domain-containing protein n=1 Tax=Gonium pectorale TaxID=33097 RepID=A0A150G637_GONPE|nr:hypothetical protein GPECTOR_56g404 [Gonium pectorale]|eukprot:KXZ45307.1 hypothetical protein GPECTOR_56g404 [Gonium pectorale]
MTSPRVAIAEKAAKLHVLAWLVETPGLGVVLDDELFEAAARSGSVELLAWLRERGCPWDSGAYTAAAKSGCEAALEWLAERGRPMPDDGYAYLRAVREEDFAILACLRRLGCPWGPIGEVFHVCFHAGSSKNQDRMLSWLLAAACPIGWSTAVAKTTAAVAQAADAAATDPAFKYWADLLEVTRAQRRELLCLTAASGATANLALAARSVGCRLKADVSYAAGKAGQLGSCTLLADLGCDMVNALRGAAAGGHLSLCEELISWIGFEQDSRVCGVDAAEAGHTRIVDWMLQQCDERYFEQLVGPGGDDEVEEDDEVWLQEIQSTIVAAAAGSPTPDWRDKLEWLESRGFPPTWEAFVTAAERPNASERFTWMVQRGYPSRPEDGYSEENAPLVAAAAAGNAAAVLFLAQGRPAGEDLSGVWCAAVEKGHLHVLQALHAVDRRGHVRATAHDAARNGQLHVLAWLVETPDLGLQLAEELFRAAAGSGSVELLAWLRERGCPWDNRTFTAAAESDCEASLEWLAERGSPMPEDGGLYVHAVKENDVAMLECLRRLGCPWGPTGHAFNTCIKECNNRTPLLSWLLAAGCPIDWLTAVDTAMAAVTQAKTSAYDNLEKWKRAHAWVCAEARRHQT